MAYQLCMTVLNAHVQMPRGNLEGVSPRALVLAAIAHALVHHDYKTAWILATTHRVSAQGLVRL
jgi:elongator complex protein 1